MTDAKKKVPLPRAYAKAGKPAGGECQGATWIVPDSVAEECIWKMHELVEGYLLSCVTLVVSMRSDEATSDAAREAINDEWRKQEKYGHEHPGTYDDYLSRLFSDDRGYAHRPTAASFLRRKRLELRNRVAAMTGQYRYVVDQALREMIAGCKRRRLRLTRSERETQIGAAILLTAGGALLGDASAPPPRGEYACSTILCCLWKSFRKSSW